jgi:hypothetical protein
MLAAAAIVAAYVGFRWTAAAILWPAVRDGGVGASHHGIAPVDSLAPPGRGGEETRTTSTPGGGPGTLAQRDRPDSAGGSRSLHEDLTDTDREALEDVLERAVDRRGSR